MPALPRRSPFMPPWCTATRRQPRGGCLAAAGAGRMCVGMVRVPVCVADQNIPATQTPKELAASPRASTVISARFMVYPSHLVPTSGWLGRKDQELCHCRKSRSAGRRGSRSANCQQS